MKSPGDHSSGGEGWAAYTGGPPPGGGDYVDAVPEHPTLMLAPEFGVRVPLWPKTFDVESLVPDDLLAKLIAWQDYFEANCHPFTGWDSGEARLHFRERGLALVAELKEALGDRAEVVADL